MSTAIEVHEKFNALLRSVAPHFRIIIEDAVEAAKAAAMDHIEAEVAGDMPKANAYKQEAVGLLYRAKLYRQVGELLLTDKTLTAEVKERHRVTMGFFQPKAPPDQQIADPR